MKLNRTNSLWNKNERNNINKNWGILEKEIKKLSEVEQKNNSITTEKIADSAIITEKIADNVITAPLLSDIVTQQIEKGGYKIGVNFGNCFFDKNKKEIEVSINKIRVFLKSGKTSTEIFGSHYKLTRNDVLYIDLDETEPTIKLGTVAIHSNETYGTGGFYDDKKVVLLSNHYDTIIGALADSFKMAVEKTLNQRLLANKTSDGLFNIYIQSKSNIRKYTKYELKTKTASFKNTKLKSNVKCTEFISAKIAYRNIDNTFSEQGVIASGGAWSCAIRETGTKDGIGGHAHGDEVERYLIVKLNGVSGKVTTELTSYKEIEFIAASDLYRESSTYTTLEKIGMHFKSYVMNYHDGLIMDSKVILNIPMTLLYVYLGMMSVLKTFTNKAITDIDLDINDLTITSPVHTKRPFIKRVDVYGDMVYVKSSVLEQESPSIPITKVEKSHYNKIYYDLVEYGFESPSNALYRQKTQFEIDLK